MLTCWIQAGNEVVRMEVSICLLCKDPVWSYICTDCLAEGIKSWLPKTLSAGFDRFHQHISSHFRNFKADASDFLRCVHCRTESEVTLCPFCYMSQVYYWLKTKEPVLAARLFKMLPIDKNSFVNEMDGVMWKNGVKPITMSEEQSKDFGICDDCGEYSDDLAPIDGKWICPECLQE